MVGEPHPSTTQWHPRGVPFVGKLFRASRLCERSADPLKSSREVRALGHSGLATDETREPQPLIEDLGEGIFGQPALIEDGSLYLKQDQGVTQERVLFT